MAYIVDADWIIEASAGNRYVVTTLENLATVPIGVSWLTAGEVFEVAFNTPNPPAALHRLQLFLDEHWMIGVNGPIMERFAETRAYLRRRGQMISDLDIILAATALHHDLTVLTFNTRHFERIPDLRIYRAG